MYILSAKQNVILFVEYKRLHTANNGNDNLTLINIEYKFLSTRRHLCVVVWINVKCRGALFNRWMLPLWLNTCKPYVCKLENTVHTFPTTLRCWHETQGVHWHTATTIEKTKVPKQHCQTTYKLTNLFMQHNYIYQILTTLSTIGNNYTQHVVKIKYLQINVLMGDFLGIIITRYKVIHAK